MIDRPAHADTARPEDTAPAADAARTVYLETFGCQMNVLDSQLVRGQLQGLGYRFTDDWQQADVILYNTCSVRERAEQKVWSRIGEVGLHKKDRPEVVLGVIGCMAERDGIDMTRRYPQVDMLCGPGELDKVPMLIDNAMRNDLNRRGGSDMPAAALQGNTHRRSQTLQAAEDQLELIDLSRSFSPDEHTGRIGIRAHHARVQQVLHLLRRALHTRPRNPPPAGPHRGRVPQARGKRRGARSPCSARRSTTITSTTAPPRTVNGVRATPSRPHHQKQRHRR